MEGESTQHEAYGFVILNRTAGCGPACPVVWEGGGLSPSPYPDFGLGIWLIRRTVNRQGASVENVGVNVAGVIEDETLGPVNVGFLSTVGA